MPIISKKKVWKKYQGNCVSPGISHVLVLLVLLLTFLNAAQRGYGQQEDTLYVQAPDISHFPEIAIPFKLPILQSELNADLKISQVMVYENGNSLQPESLDKERSGVHFTLAVNPGRQLDLRDSNGVSPYDKLQEALVDWSQSRTSFSGDRWSLVSDVGVEISNSNDRTLWVNALKAYQPNFRMLEPGLSSLETAINLASERVVPFGVDKALLYITPAPLAGQLEAINTLSNTARSAGVQVNVWLVDEAYFLTNEQGSVLINLAKNTGGNFFNFTGIEDFPDPEAYLANLGYYFKLTYQSGIRETGTMPLGIGITTTLGEIRGESSPLYIELKPPNPILVSPPAIIKRTQSENADYGLSPTAQLIEIMMEFPDCHPRPLVLSRLYVDGKVVDERDTPPFDALEWDLTSLTDPGEHSIQVEVEDSLGFSAKTITTPVQVEVILPEHEEGLTPKQIGFFLLGFVLLISFAIFISSLIRRYWQADRVKNLLPARLREESSAGVNLSKMVEEKDRVVAGLFPLQNRPGSLEGMLSFSRSRVYIGRDTKKADLIIDDKSIEDAHALLHHDEINFWLNDLDTSCGTWVNYVQISRQPVRIQAGDIIHFGNCGFRFTIIDANTPQVTVSKYEPAI